VIAIAFLPACLLNWDALREQDSGGFDSGGNDVATIDAPDDVVGNDASDGGTESGSCTLQLTINEVQADGVQGPSDEFVELRNGASCGASLQGWSLRYSSAGGSSPSLMWTGQAGDTIGANGYVILGGYAFQAPDGGNLIGRISTDLNGSLSKSGGGVGLFSPSLALVDGVAYETLTTQTHPFIRPSNAGSAGGAPNPPSGKSIARTPDGKNTNTNATDFQIATPSPGVSN
jgi:hypothetical protein